MEGIELIALTGDNRKEKPADTLETITNKLFEGNNFLYVIGAGVVLLLLYTSSRKGL